MRPILILAATLAALCFVTPAEAKLFDRIRDRNPTHLAVTVAPELKTEAIAAPKQRRLRLIERVRAYRAASKSIRAARVTVVE